MKNHNLYLAAGGGLLAVGVLVALASEQRETVTRLEEMVSGWFNTLLRKTIAHEGQYWSVQRNLDGAGLSYGILQWTQSGGGLYEVLRAMQNAEPELFRAVFAADGPSLLAAIPKGEAALRSVLGTEIDPGGPDVVLSAAHRKDLSVRLWESPYVERFQAAGRFTVFQQAQRAAAYNSDYLRYSLKIAETLGLRSERAMTMFFNRTVHQGPDDALNDARVLAAWWAEQPGRKPRSDKGILAQYGWRCASQYRRTDAPANPCANRECSATWVQVQSEHNLDAEGRLIASTGPAWHVKRGQFDLWEIIIRRSADIIGDASLSDGQVSLEAPH